MFTFRAHCFVIWKVWWVLMNTLCSPLLSPWHSAASCYAAAGPAADCTILTKSRACSSPKRRWTILVAFIYGGQGNRLFIRSCRDSAPCRIRPFSEFRVNLCAVPSCNAALYTCSHVPMQVFIRSMNIVTGFSWHRFCFFLCYIGDLFFAMLLSLFTYPGDSSFLWNISCRHLGVNRAFSLTDLRWLLVSKIPCKGPWMSWWDQGESMV